MTEIERIADQLDRAYDGSAWHGDPLLAILDGVDAGKARRRPLADAHSIWELALHIAAWEQVVMRRLRGEMVRELPPGQDWEVISDTGDGAWAEARSRLEERHGELRGAILSFPAARLDERVPGQEYSFYVMLHGVVQHTLYHAGQMALLKKAF
jgi:uncharacterized damage-inducible protein DinB